MDILNKKPTGWRTALYTLLVLLVSGCNFEVDMTRYVPTAFPIQKRLYSSDELFCAVNIFQIKEEFKQDITIEKLNAARSILIKTEYGEYEKEIYPFWQKTPIDETKMHENAQEWGTIKQTNICTQDDKIYNEIIADAIYGSRSYFTYSGGRLVIYNEEKNLIIIADFD